MLKILKDLFDYDSFNIGQEEAIKAILDKRDVFVSMSTGSGKSLCYQLPSLILRSSNICSKAVTFIVSPLIALMSDQCISINSRLYLDSNGVPRQKKRFNHLS